MKKKLRMTIMTKDNGYTLDVYDETPIPRPLPVEATVPERVELVFTSKPKLMKAISEFLNIDSEEEEGSED